MSCPIDTSPRLQATEWQRELTRAFTDPAHLFDYLGLNPAHLADSMAAASQFGLLVPRGYAALMRKGDPADPLLRQVLPQGAELVNRSGFHRDPVGDLESQQAPGLLQKYHGRALLIATGACAVHCRYCFRRHYPYPQATAGKHRWESTVRHIEHTETLREIILSGGDPLTLSDARLSELSGRLDRIEHLSRLRIHTRLPLVLPERVDERLLDWLAASRLRPVMVIHANHAREFSPAATRALQALRCAGVTLLNQSVLLQGVNASANELAELSEALFAGGVMPYYLHALDRVQGAAHFEVHEHKAQALMRELNARLPGYLVPKLVRELPGEAAKTLVTG